MAESTCETLDEINKQETLDMFKVNQAKGDDIETVAKTIRETEKFKADKEKSRNFLTKIGMLHETFDARMDAMATDMAQRELEVIDFMPFERAGLSEEEQRQIPKLDETNNDCYKWMRDNGYDWQYNPNNYCNEYKNRLYRRFDTFDKDSDGFMTIREVLYWADRMRTICGASDNQVEEVRGALREYFTQYGLAHGDGLNRENFVEAHCTMAQMSRYRRECGEHVPMEKLANAYFGVLDQDQDGKINMEELKQMMNVFRVPEEAAYPFFEYADKDQSGGLDVEEMHNLFFAFWFEDYNKSLDHIFAYKY